MPFVRCLPGGRAHVRVRLHPLHGLPLHQPAAARPAAGRAQPAAHLCVISVRCARGRAGARAAHQQAAAWGPRSAPQSNSCQLPAASFFVCPSDLFVCFKRTSRTPDGFSAQVPGHSSRVTPHVSLLTCRLASRGALPDPRLNGPRCRRGCCCTSRLWRCLGCGKGSMWIHTIITPTLGSTSDKAHATQISCPWSGMPRCLCSCPCDDDFSARGVEGGGSAAIAAGYLILRIRGR
mmetsp:Transcript_17007/g.50984  ORF Transcript_17007/g.50984 Transcript_17007/m.50984 type:complete len:235 (-) Transcript_17007:267-971(-)